MIIWELQPEKFPEEDDNTKRYKPGCELDKYLWRDRERELVEEKLSRGCTIFYRLGYLGHFRGDARRYGKKNSGYYSFQC
jgi:hypothetical protein